jgi:hypothetical protein
MSKVITINPDLFKISNNRTSKKRSNGVNPGIKMKTTKAETDKSKTFRKNQILKYIRQKQEDNIKNALSVQENVKNHADPPKPITDHFNSDFEESLKYMTHLAENNQKKQATNNNTLRQWNSSGSTPPAFEKIHSTILPVSIPNPNLDTITNAAMKIMNPVTNLMPPPQWGCLKNGSLPTYRKWVGGNNVTQKNHSNGTTLTPYTNPTSVATSPSVATSLSQQSQLLQQMAKINEPVPEQKPAKINYPKQKRTVRRSYSVGKSKKHPKISVLISNRTIRNNTTTKTQLLKQTPIEEVRRFLIKKGFIKVGSSAPNDVLRKMYETASLICGEIENHNPDNLLYNFLHDITK